MRIRLAVVGLVAVLSFGCGEQAAPEVGTIRSALNQEGQYLISVKNVAKVTALVQGMGGTVIYAHRSGFILAADLSEANAAALALDKNVVEITFDDSFQIDAISNQAVDQATLPQSPANPAGAYFWAHQWNMRAIAADKAWARGRLGSPSVTVAVLDTGIDYTYPDLQGRVDLSRSASFVRADDALVAAYFPGKHPVTDLHYHGTHVAATVASNALVAAGVTSQTTLMGVKVCSVYGSCPFGSIIAGFYHAVENGAQVINMSLGGAFSKAGAKGFGGYINKVFNYANVKGVTVVVAAGNEGTDLDHNGNVYNTYCDTPNTLCVSATGPDATGNVDAPAYYTNYGISAINVAAPGGSLYGWVRAACSQTSLLVPVCQTGVYVIGVIGTSMASPHAAGLAALVVEDVGAIPGLVKAKIMQQADDLGPKGADPFYGIGGRINVNATVR